MKVAELKDGESVEEFRQVRRLNPIVLQDDLCRITNATMVEARRHKSGADRDVRQWKVLEVKKIYPLTKNLRLMVLLDFESLSRVPRPETLLKNRQNFLGRHCLSWSF